MAILYYGCYLDSDIVRRRGLKTFNAAGSNRLIRLANAMRVSQKMIVVSQAVSLRQSFTGVFYHKGFVRRVRGVVVVTLPSIGLPVLGSIIAPAILIISWITTLRRHCSPKFIIIYNFSIALAMFAFFARILRIKIIHNVEDVSIPLVSDLLPKSDASLMQGIPFFLSMKFISALSIASIIPSARFRRFLCTKRDLVISGCVERSTKAMEEKRSLPLRILYAGKIELEFGASVVVEAIERLAEKYGQDSFELIVCGEESLCHKWFRNKVSGLPVITKGFLSRNEFEEVLRNADVCLVLQNEAGRYNSLKIPSKLFEYISNGKVVIASPLEEIIYLPNEFVITTDFNGDCLAKCIEKLILEYEKIVVRKAAAYRYGMNEWGLDTSAKRFLAFFKEIGCGI